MSRRNVPIALLLAVAVLIPVQNPEPASGADTSSAPAVASQALACKAKAPADPSIWEQDLPTAKVSADMLASDPGCVSEVGRAADRVVWRNADKSLTARTYSSPVNFKAADGSWKAIDTRLQPDGDGGTVNRGGPLGVHFAADASAPELVRVDAADASVTFGVKGAATTDGSVTAPSAKTSGVVGGDASDTMTYADAFPGVDLQYQMFGDELKETIVLNQPLAAGSSTEFRFSLATKGVTVRAADDGSIQFVDVKGTIVFAIPAGSATDASGATTSVSYSLVRSDDPNVSELRVSLDSKWLSDAARTYPVAIDPSFVRVYAGYDADVADLHATTNYSLWGLLDTTLGKFVLNTGKYSGENFRGLQTFDVSSLAGAGILSATWNGYAYAVSGTTPVAITLRPNSATWDPFAVTWNTKPALRTNSVAPGGFSAGGWQQANITSWVQNWVSGTWSNYGLSLVGPTTGRAQIAAAADNTGKGSFIDVTYDAPPVPSNFSAGGQYDPTAVHWLQPTLSATLTDPDTATGLSGHFQVWNSAHTTQLYPSTGSGLGSTASSGQATRWQVPSNLTAGTTYAWRVQPDDNVALSVWSAWQTLKVDQSAPNTPTASVAGVTANTWVNAGGSSATANFGGNGSTDVYGFEWGLDVGSNPTTVALATSNAASVTINPTWGWHDLAVRSIDGAGNVSTGVQHFTFGWGVGGFAAPQDNATTQARVTAQVNTTTSYTGISLQWRRADTDTWANIPTTDVTYQSSGAGIGSWPVTATPGANSTVFPALVWNAVNTVGGVDGTLQLRAGFYQAGTYTYLTDTASIPHMTLDQAPFGAGVVSAGAGPGQVNLLTGNLAIGSQDVSVPGGSVSRTFNSRDANATGGVFGAGWTTAQAGAFTSVTESPTGNTATVLAADQTQLAFGRATNSTYPYTYTPPAGSDLVLTKTSAIEFRLTRPSSPTYVFAPQTGAPTGVYSLTQAIAPLTGLTATTTYQFTNGLVQPKFIFAATDSSITCNVSTYATTAGCQTISFDYASTTQNTTLCAGFGDFIGQLRTVRYTAWDPDKSGGAGMNVVNVATYCYGSAGRLRAVWDPRVSPALKTQYTYNTDGQIATLTPPGSNAWNFTYAPLSGEPAGTGRLATVYRAELSPLGNATTTFVYKIPLTTALGGPYNLDATTVGTWGQQDLPTDATAVFPPDQLPSGSPPTSYTRATIAYLDANARAVNTAAPGGYITTTEYDDVGHVVRTLSAANRKEALAFSTTAAVQTSQSRLLDSQNAFDPIANVNVVDTYGPAHMVVLPDATQRLARAHKHFVYDQGAPGTFNLVTTGTESATPIDGTADQDARSTTYAYTFGSNTSGWTLGTPLQTIIDPGTGSHLHLTTTTIYDPSTGLLVARALPANPNGGDTHETDFVSYTAGTNTPASCGGHPEWAGLPCYTTPYAQPGTAGLPNLATTQVTKYNMYGQAQTTVDTNGTSNRTTTVVYDAAGRQISQHVTGTGAGTALPTITQAYDATTGQLSTTSDGTLTITRTYDALGRLHYYQDADGNISIYTYDLLDRISTLYDGYTPITYTYNDVGTEKRGLPTTINYGAGIGSFTAIYDANGNVSSQDTPGGFTTTYTRDEAGQLTDIANIKGASWWPDATAQYNIHGEKTAATAALEDYTYGYDAAGRLTEAMSVGEIFSCPDQHNYTFDADTNRTQLQDTTGCSGSQTTTTTNSTYDSADRVTTSGYAYDAFGRTTTIPASNTTTGIATTPTYYANDLVKTIGLSGGSAATYNLDPNQRAHTFTISSDPTRVHTNHYTGDGASPAWTSEDTAGTTWNRYLQGFNGMGATVNQAGTITIQFVNTHGDIYGTVASTATDVFDSSYAGLWTDEYGIPLGTPVRYDYLGTHQIKRDGNSGLMLMGLRVYNPQTGRFLQTDPVIGGSSNNYDYTNGDPINGTDLTGQSSCKACDVWIWVAAYYRNEQIKLWNATLLWNSVADWNKRAHPARGPAGPQGPRYTPEPSGGGGGCGGWTGWAHCSWHWSQRNFSTHGIANTGGSIGDWYASRNWGHCWIAFAESLDTIQFAGWTGAGVYFAPVGLVVAIPAAGATYFSGRSAVHQWSEC